MNAKRKIEDMIEREQAKLDGAVSALAEVGDAALSEWERPAWESEVRERKAAIKAFNSALKAVMEDGEK